MKLTPKEISELNSRAAFQRVERGTHHWTTEEHSERTSKRVRDAVKNGSYHMLGGEIQKNFQLERSKNKIHQWNGSSQNEKMLRDGTHPSLQVYTCPHCNVTGKGAANAKRWHFDNCKDKK